MILHGDCLDKLKTLKSNSIDSIVTDPPYGLSFMGKKWDYDVPSVEIWRECLRVLKPGGHLLSFAGTRTYHRMACNIEDAGFEIRDQIMWLYGSGFPKSMDVSKAIDKQAGATREVVAEVPHTTGLQRNNSIQRAELDGKDTRQGKLANEMMKITAPATEAAKQWQGWGTALKPANEPIVVARKPLEAGLTVAANVLKYGTGALNIEASRIGTETRSYSINAAIQGGNFGNGANQPADERDSKTVTGRWPANVLLDEEAAAALDEQSGESQSRQGKPRKSSKPGEGYGMTHTGSEYSDSGGASRFFYVAKASKRERNAGLEGMPVKRNDTHNNPSRMVGSSAAKAKIAGMDQSGTAGNQNHHPTVKPVKLMEYLIRLVTPANGIVLDPFMGSGTTGVAAKRLKCKFIGIEREKEYKKIAEKRIEAVA